LIFKKADLGVILLTEHHARFLSIFVERYFKKILDFLLRIYYNKRWITENEVYK